MNIDQHRALMPAQFNLNDDVKVKLTDHGRDLLAKKRLTRQPDEAGYNRFQLWELMNIFGEHFYNGCSIPFEFNRILLAPFNPAMNDQHRADPRLWAAAKKWGANTMDMANCILELRDRVEALEGQYETQRQATLAWGKDVDNHSRWIDDHLKRIMALEAGQKTKPSPAVDRVRDLQDQIRDGSLTLAEALKEIDGEPEPVQPFTAKYLFTAGNIQEDSFCYDQSDSNSVLFDIANLELGDGCLTPGDNIKIVHRWGEPPASGVYSTINYKITSVSETKNRAWTIRAVRVSSAPDPTVRTMLPSGLPATSDPITRRLWQPLRTEITYGEANAHAQDLVRHLSMDHLNYPEIPDSSPAPADSLVERVCVEAGIHNPADARAAIREVAAALIDWHHSDEVVRTAYEAGQWLKREADA
jgi:uncharacterized protein (DUF2267 family)